MLFPLFSVVSFLSRRRVPAVFVSSCLRIYLYVGAGAKRSRVVYNVYTAYHHRLDGGRAVGRWARRQACTMMLRKVCVRLPRHVYDGRHSFLASPHRIRADWVYSSLSTFSPTCCLVAPARFCLQTHYPPGHDRRRPRLVGRVGPRLPS